MNEIPTPEFVKSDNPGREFGYPPGVTEVVFAMFGFQAPEPGQGDEFIKTMRSLFDADRGPIRIERCHGVTSGVHEDILMAYWIATETYAEWASSEAFTAWWDSLPVDGPYGYWREILSPTIDRVGGVFFGLEADRLVGLTGTLGAEPTERWGYWGGYRDRFSASAADPFEPELGAQPYERRTPSTRGRRVIVQAPNNLLFVREGEESTHMTGPTERELWDQQVKPALDKWIEYLAKNPAQSGALVLRSCIEQDIETGEETEKHTQLVYFQSLRHLERAARTQPSHLGLYNTYMKMLEQVTASGETPSMIGWVEQFLLQKGRLLAEYVNCDPQVGLLPWFDLSEP